MHNKPRLVLKPRPDGYGFPYGELTAGDDVHRVNIMPPRGEWDGDVELPNYAPHATDWVIYVDGEEIARVRQRDDLEGAILGRLTAR